LTLLPVHETLGVRYYVASLLNVDGVESLVARRLADVEGGHEVCICYCVVAEADVKLTGNISHQRGLLRLLLSYL
jgi:hypothetical protein